jgi:alpha-1,3-mannosyl-glycoprotein beta-1,2-N-acetylglucosaminyltransferase
MVSAQPEAVLLIACDRAAYLERMLASLLCHNRPALPVVISQDGADPGVAAVIGRYQRDHGAIHLRHLRPDPSRLPPNHAYDPRWKGYCRIARHYRWAFEQVFERRGLERVIVLEDDLELAPDFFDYFRVLAPLLERDPTIRTISAWNDNGYPTLGAAADRCHRTECFPGLGWLMTRALWRDVAADWPEIFWDDWLRARFRRSGWVAIRPEVSRTRTFGVHGVSLGENFERYLAPLVLNDRPVDLAALDVGALEQARYDGWLRAALADAPLVTLEQAARAEGAGDRKVLYHGEAGFAPIAELFGVMPEFREGMPRTSYRGVVMFRRRWGGTVFAIPLSYLLESPQAGPQARLEALLNEPADSDRLLAEFGRKALMTPR